MQMRKRKDNNLNLKHQDVQGTKLNKLAKLGDAIAISNLKLSITDSLTDPH